MASRSPWWDVVHVKIVSSVYAMSPCALKLEGAPGETIVTMHHMYHSVCPNVRIGTPHPSPQASVLPLERKGGIPSPAGEGVGGSQFRRLEKKLSTLLCGYLKFKSDPTGSENVSVKFQIQLWIYIEQDPFFSLWFKVLNASRQELSCFFGSKGGGGGSSTRFRMRGWGTQLGRESILWTLGFIQLPKI